MLFDTAAGPVRIRYSDEAITAIELPELSPRDLRAQLSTEAGNSPQFVREAARLLGLHLAGEPQDLSALPLALTSLPPFRRQVFEAARAVPAGKTATYGELAHALGKPGAARAIGQALGRNPFLVAVPCHRIVAAQGKSGGFSAPGGLATKARLLAAEGVRLAAESGKAARALAELEAAQEFQDAVPALCKADRKLARFIERVGPCRLRPASLGQPFQALAESIVYQQLTGKAAATILARVVALYAPLAFPRPQDVLETTDEALRAAGLSGAKTAALKDLAAKAQDGTVPSLAQLRRLSDDEIVERLSSIRGIGRWTVEMMLIFRLGRPDVLPATDYGVRKGFARVYGGELPAPRALLEYGERWRPHRTVASWYLWRVLEL
jgi:methylated-DNA-[protein]-cysteine S-methyltransferase